MVTTSLSVIIVPGQGGSFSPKGTPSSIEIAGDSFTNTNIVNQGILQPISIFGSFHTNTSILNEGIIYFGVKLSTSQRELLAVTEDPSPYTISTSANWVAMTIGIKGT